MRPAMYQKLSRIKPLVLLLAILFFGLDFSSCSKAKINIKIDDLSESQEYNLDSKDKGISRLSLSHNSKSQDTTVIVLMSGEFKIIHRIPPMSNESTLYDWYSPKVKIRSLSNKNHDGQPITLVLRMF